MINQLYIDKLISLINSGLITIEDIKNSDYKTEVQNRLSNLPIYSIVDELVRLKMGENYQVMQNMATLLDETEVI